MRITNRMMTNDMLTNINGNKNRLANLSEQYSTGLKIQKPSEDPIIAVRALKLRTNLSELNQYYEKNIPDAKAWMDVTEGAMNTVNDILTQMNTYCVQGSNDTLTQSDRDSIVANVKELKDQIYQEGNSNYAGRYVFTGYKTDTTLVFDDITTNYNYEITEKLTASNIDVIDRSINSVELSQYDADSPADSDFTNKPNTVTCYRMQLAYDDLIGEDVTAQINLNPTLNADGSYVYDVDGNLQYDEAFTNVVTVSSKDAAAYLPEEGTVNFIAETGELIIAEDVYTTWKNAVPETQVHVTYQKDTFDKNDLKPEHYFDCTRTEIDSEGNLEADTVIEFTKEDQQIEYEVNFNQKLNINTQGSNAIKHEIGRCVDEITQAVEAVALTETKIAETEKMLLGQNVTEEQTAALNEMLELLKTEKTIKDELLQSTFERAITTFQEQQNVVSVALADLGSRYVRLELTESRLSSQQDDFTDLLSQNEDADIAETVINYNAQETIYNASLSAAAKVVQNTLLDFL